MDNLKKELVDMTPEELRVALSTMDPDMIMSEVHEEGVNRDDETEHK